MSKSRQADLVKDPSRVLLFSNRPAELDTYVRLLEEQALPIILETCRNPQEVMARVPSCEIIFGVHLPAQAYANASNLRWIQSMWAGVEKLLPELVAPEVVVTKPWGAFGSYISQYVFAYLLAHKVNMKEGLRCQAMTTWQQYRTENIQGQVLGVAGLGDIGSAVARVGAVLGMDVWGLNRDGRPHVDAIKTFAQHQVADFVRGVDILVLTLPSTAETVNLFQRDILSLMKRSALLINVGRGNLVDEAALVEMLLQKKIAGAVLDVFSQEPLPADHPFWRLDNCLVTPHISGPSEPEAITRCFVENLRRFRSGQDLLGVVDRKRGY